MMRSCDAQSSERHSQTPDRRSSPVMVAAGTSDLRRSFADLLVESVAAQGLFRSHIVGASFPNLKVERIRQSYALALRRLNFARHSDVEVPVLEAAVHRLGSLVSRLDNNVIIGREVDEMFRRVGTREAREAFLGYPPEIPPSGVECRVMRRAGQRSLRSRAAELRFRIQEELARPGVFPVFATLTTDPQYEHIYSPGDETLKLWFRRVRRVLGDFTYCAVLERGGEGKLHFHVLMVFEECRFSDPNRGRALCDHQEVVEIKRLWRFGHSSPIAVRYGVGDVYGVRGWRWPRDRKTGSPGQVAGYMAKYVTKVQTMEVNGCRTRMSRLFGCRRLLQVLNQPGQMVLVEALLRRGSPKWSASNKWPARPPSGLVLRLSFKLLCERRFLRRLPPMRRGSVSVASEMLRTGVFSRMSVGALDSLPGGFRCLDPFRSQAVRCAMGALI